MRSLTRLAVPVAAAALLLAGCSSTANDDADDTAPPAGEETPEETTAAEPELLEEGVLSVCTNPPYEPFEYEEGGEVVGLDMDIVAEVAKDLGADLEIKVTPFEGIQSGQDLDSGNCDVVASGITITPEREDKMDFSDPYFDADQGLLVPAGSDLAALEDLTDATVGVQTATTGLSFAEDNGLNYVEFEDLGLQIEALRSGSVDAVINDIAVLGPFASDDFEVATTFPTGEQYGLGVKTGNEGLLAAVNATLERIMSDGTYDTLYEKYIGTAPAEG